MRPLTYLRHAGVYAVGELLLQAAGVILLPLYTRWLTRADFGNLEILERTGEVLTICLLARGIPQAVFALAKQSRTDDERRRVVGGSFMLAGLIAAAGLLMLLPLANSAGDWLRLES